METNQLTKVNPQGLTNYSNRFVPIPQITAEENEVLRIKYESLPFGKLTDTELFRAARLLLLKIHVIVGWSIPEKELKDILTDQFTKKIRESYSNVNTDEVEYAFRQNISVQDWGKNMNLALIDSVISEYLERRLDISRLEEKYKSKPVELPPIIEPMTDDEYIEMNYSTWKVMNNYGFISERCYGILVRQCKINLVQAEKDEMYRKMEISLKEKMNTDPHWHGELKRAYDNPERWKIFVFNECKRKAVENYFKTL